MMNKRILSIILMIVLLISALPVAPTIHAIEKDISDTSVYSLTLADVTRWLNNELSYRNWSNPVGGGECVEFCNYYLTNCWGTPAIRGNARDWQSKCPDGWSSLNRIYSFNGLRIGDLIIEDYAPYGHVAVYYGYEEGYHQVVDQNSFNGRYVSKHKVWKPCEYPTYAFRPPINNDPPTPLSHNPIGCFDSVTSENPSEIHLRGWAFDWDNVNAELLLHVYVNDKHYATIKANQSRPDVNNAYAGAGNNHGFDDRLILNTSGNINIKVYAINIGEGSNVLIENGEKTVNANGDSNTPKLMKSCSMDGHEYRLYACSTTWKNAKTICEEKGGYLATITSAREQRLLYELLGEYSPNNFFLGAENKSGSWKWVTGEPFSYTAWAENQPDCSGNAEFYLGLYDSEYHYDYRSWNDFTNDYSDMTGFVFESGAIEENIEAPSDNPPTVSYSGKIGNFWTESAVNGETIGAENGKRFKALKIDLQNCTGGIKYAAHFSETGWGDYVLDNAICSSGTDDMSIIEAIKMELYGDVADNYNVFYRSFVSSKGWLEWAKNGEVSGSTGGALPITAIQVMLVPQIRCSAHVQDKGWLNSVKDKEVCGTTGEKLQIEALKINLKDTSYGNIQYKTHVTELSWGNSVYNGKQSGTTSLNLQAEAFQVKLDGRAVEMYDVMYRAHVQDKDWMAWVRNGETAGTTAEALRMEAFMVMVVPKGYSGGETYKDYTNLPIVSYSVKSNNEWSDRRTNGRTAGEENIGRFDAIRLKLWNCSGGIKYAACFSDSGWSEYAHDNEICSDKGINIQYSFIEAVKMELYGDVASNYNIFYRTYVRDKGWLGWTKNGEPSGSTGGSLPITSIQIMLVPQVRYSAHVQDLDWLERVKDREVCGTTGQNLQIEAIKIYLKDTAYGNICYNTHIQDTGWNDYSYNGDPSGTIGLSQRVESFKVRLDGEAEGLFDVMYKAHVQDKDWMDWVRNGEVAGTTGERLRLEAFKVMVVPKSYVDTDAYKEYSAETYTVTFNSMGGNCSIKTKSVSYCGFFKDLPTPTKDDYVFAGWYDSEEFDKQITSSSTLETKTNITLYAKWIAKEKPIYLGDVDGDSTIEIRDATWIQRHIAEVEMPFTISVKTADVDGDGIITVMDATAIQYYLANMKTSYKIGEKIE